MGKKLLALAESETVHDTASVIEIFGAGGIMVQRTIPVPAGGGITVLMGGCGTGKTTSLDAVKTLLGNRVPSLTANDTLGKGYVRGLGTEVTFGKSVRRSGVPVNELEVVHLEDRFDLSQIVNPGIKDPEKNDAVRLRAMVQISGVVVDPQEFLDLIDDGHSEIDLSSVANASDPVEMATNFKRAVQKHALAIEKEAKPIQARADACEMVCEGVDLKEPCDAELLSSAYSAAVAKKAKLLEQRESATKMAAAVVRANARIAELNSGFSGLPIELASKEVESKSREVELARELMAAAEKRLEKAVSDRAMAEKERDRALEHEASLNAMRGILDEAESVGSGPTDEEIGAAMRDETVAAMSLSRGEAVRNAKSKHNEAVDLAAEAKQLLDSAAALRKSATQADEVLSRAITVPNVRFFGGRMIYGKNGTEELFDRLSEGQKWSVAVDSAVIGLCESTGDGTRLCVLQQEAWQSLDHRLRCHLDELVHSACINVITGQVSSGDLRAVIFDRNTEL